MVLAAGLAGRLYVGSRVGISIDSAGPRGDDFRWLSRESAPGAIARLLLPCRPALAGPRLRRLHRRAADLRILGDSERPAVEPPADPFVTNRASARRDDGDSLWGESTSGPPAANRLQGAERPRPQQALPGCCNPRNAITRSASAASLLSAQTDHADRARRVIAIRQNQSSAPGRRRGWSHPPEAVGVLVHSLHRVDRIDPQLTPTDGRHRVGPASASARNQG